ncbi:NAD(P)H-binding protein [Pseudonocardia hydrocarbonoxydans]|uniref:NmrA family transcriptional regulator n=1 Tax=Pseudonocardia hydrocarbonoxydans TaxID=76726 RepID=A0A4Y3WRJ1_9PSEU|nr:NAD(P)H-binding protein [Pseudonocardia hydrocarbonoxydans]GEC20419.1 NmrA family transcriptional regulator [Pseudonocardia hydrocarbonoxydans]
MRIAVTTPTGNVGRHVLAMLVRAGLRPVALLRDPARLPEAVRGHVDAVRVDLTDADAVVAATAGADALFWVDPPGTGDDPTAHYARLGAHAARAVTENGIGRTVFQSSVGAELRHGVGEIDGLARTEELLDATGAPVLHLRCGFFFTNLLLQPLSGVVPVVLPVDLPMPWVAPRDIAEVAVGRLLAGWTGRRVQAVHGPEDLSWEQATAVVARATGRPLRAERVPDEEMRGMLRGAGLGERQVESIMGMSTGMRDGFVSEQPRDATTTTPTTLASWAWDELR